MLLIPLLILYLVCIEIEGFGQQFPQGQRETGFKGIGGTINGVCWLKTRLLH